MFQSGKVRELADEQHICVNCKKETGCKVFPHDQYKWRYILTYCQRYEEKESK